MAITKWSIETHKFGSLLNGEIFRPTDGQDVRSHPMTTKERFLMIRKTIFAVATVAAIGDYDVICDDAVVGRIMHTPAAPEARPWRWSLAYGYHRDR
jgi:hypothetical protein